MGNFIIDILNFLIKILGTVLNGILSVLPTSPFVAINNSSVSEYLGGLAWIIPLPQIITMLETWLACIVVYYTYSIVMRWIKVIG